MIFQRNKTEANPTVKELQLHRHQEDAIRCAAREDNSILATGTCLGKSLSYIIAIVDFVLRTGSGGGVKAIIVYPMNVLADSQEGEPSKLLDFRFGDERSATFRRYTGQERDRQRDELIMIRPREATLLQAAIP